VNFGPEWNHGLRLVFRRVYQMFVGPTPSIHQHYHSELWQFPIGIGPLVLIFFVHWQRPVTDSAYHFHKLGVDILFGPWTQCLHWLDEGVKEDE
jgi:hypothetical protein